MGLIVRPEFCSAQSSRNVNAIAASQQQAVIDVLNALGDYRAITVVCPCLGQSMCDPVRCDASGYVTEIDYEEQVRSLNGSISESIGTLTNLYSFDVAGNTGLTGTVPAALFNLYVMFYFSWRYPCALDHS
jgi:hypothetical protein